MLTFFDPKKHTDAEKFYVRCGGYDEKQKLFWDGWCPDEEIALADAITMSQEDPHSVMVEVPDETERPSSKDASG